MGQGKSNSDIAQINGSEISSLHDQLVKLKADRLSRLKPTVPRKTTFVTLQEVSQEKELASSNVNFATELSPEEEAQVDGALTSEQKREIIDVG